MTVKELIKEIERLRQIGKIDHYEVRIRSYGKVGDHYKTSKVIASGANPILVIE